MPAPFRRLTLAEFGGLLARYPFTRRVNQVHMHHTWRPNRAQWRGAASVQAMYDFHTRTNGWSDIAQHLTVAPDGAVWTGRSFNQAPASSSGFNGTSAAGPFMFEIVGDFDVGRDPFDGAQRDAVIEVIARVQLRFGLTPESLQFHRALGSLKTCPGNAVSYTDTVEAVREMRRRLTAAPRVARGRAAGAPNGAPHGAPARSPFGDEALAAGDVAELLSVRPAGEDPAHAELAEEQAGADYAAHVTGDRAAVAPAPAANGSPNGARGGAAAPPLSPEQLHALRPHVINLSQGAWSADGVFQTSEADADAIVDRHLAAALAEARARGERLRVLAFAHGGLVDEASGLRIAHHQLGWWRANGVYPLFFVWETGLMATVKQLLQNARARLPLVGARDLWDRTSDPLVEVAARALGGAKVWGGMKWSAERASAAGGGARHVAERLGAFVAANAPDVELHAVGHSAGSIFHAHFLPALVAAGAPGVRTLQLLAPASRTDLFKARLLPLVADGRVAACTMYTMAQDWEKADDCNGVYRKSLLYLVSRAFERERPAPILGLEESVRADAELRDFFGLGGAPGRADVVWAVTGGAPQGVAGHMASTSRSHGGFDDDAPTMTSVLRRVLGDADGTRPVTAFPSAGTRSLVDADPWPEELAWAAQVAGAPAAPAPNGAADATAAVPAASPAAVDPFAGADTSTSVAQALAQEDVGYEADADADDADAPDGSDAARPAPARPSAQTKSRAGRRRALCVGINTYPDAPLYGCVADAERWRDTLAAIGFDDVRLLTDAQATRAAILASLADVLRSSEAGDVVVFQYAGHGTQVPDVDGDERSGGPDMNDEALCPVDYADGRFLVDDDLRRVFARTPAGVGVTCFMDCCHSGTITRMLAGGPPRPAAGDADGVRVRYLDLARQAPQALARYRATRAADEAAEAAAEAAAPNGDGGRAPAAGGDRASMRTVLYSACLSTEVAYESNGHGDFTRNVTPLLRAAVRDGVSLVEFRKRVLTAFGRDPRQHPTLDCPPAVRTQGLLQPVAQAARAADAAAGAELVTPP